MLMMYYEVMMEFGHLGEGWWYCCICLVYLRFDVGYLCGCRSWGPRPALDEFCEIPLCFLGLYVRAIHCLNSVLITELFIDMLASGVEYLQG
jgi:hypothetical protein